MLIKTTCLAAALVGLAAAPAMATTLTSSLAGFTAGTAGLAVQRTTLYPGFDPNAFSVTTNVIPLTGGGSVGLSNTTLVTQGANQFGQFPYTFTDGFSGEIFIPNDANGNNVSSEVISTAGLGALGFEVAPYGAAAAAPNFGFKGGPFTVTVTTNSGQSISASLPGGNFNTGTTPSQFFGFYGGGVSSLTVTVTSATVSTSDPNGFAFGNFVDVPEPASAALLLGAGLTLLTRLRRRTATAA